MKKTYKKPSIFSEDLRLCLVTLNCTINYQQAYEKYSWEENGLVLNGNKIFIPGYPDGDGVDCQMTPQDYNNEFGGSLEVCYLNPDDTNVVFNS